MKIIEANEGQKISYSTTKTWLNVSDQIMLNLKKYEADNDVHIEHYFGYGRQPGNRCRSSLVARGHSGQNLHGRRNPEPGLFRRNRKQPENNYQARSGSVLYGQRDLDPVRAERRCNL